MPIFATTGASSSAPPHSTIGLFYREHWFAIRRLGNQWFNLNSLLEGPELVKDLNFDLNQLYNQVSNSYLGEFLAQLQQEGYSIFLVTGTLPECDADLVLQARPILCNLA